MAHSVHHVRFDVKHPCAPYYGASGVVQCEAEEAFAQAMNDLLNAPSDQGVQKWKAVAWLRENVTFFTV